MTSIIEFSLVVFVALTSYVEIGCTALAHQKQVTHYGSLDAEAVKTLFQDFTMKYNKVYLSSEEREKRMKIFSENLRHYDKMNTLEMGTATYGIDRFSDMTVEEFKGKMLTLNAKALEKMSGETYDGSDLENVHLPKNFDWRKKGAVTAVKDQGDCGSCWAFSAVGNMESLYYIKHKQIEHFSEQQLVDCDRESRGCAGGWMEYAVNYVKKAGGLQTNSTYPYVGKFKHCAFDKKQVVLKVKGNRNLPSGNEKKMAQYLFKNGPISVALDATAMFGYEKGISHPHETVCNKEKHGVNHGIVLVGFGVKAEKQNGRKVKVPFWIAKNSWGDAWGVKGYYYIYRGDSTCGIDTFPSSAILE